jgi:hypothetical protein
VKQQIVTGTVVWSTNTGCGTTPVTTNPDGSGTATCTTSRASSLPVGTDLVTAAYSGDSNHAPSTGTYYQMVQGGIATTIDVTSVSPASEGYGSTMPVTITAVLSWTGNGVAPTASDVTIGGNGTGTYGATSCAARVHETITCTATFTPTGTDAPGSYTETAAFSGDINYAASSSPETGNFIVTTATSSVAVSSSGSPSVYGQSVTFTATITGEFNAIKGGGKNSRKGVKEPDVTGTVTWSDNTGCSTTTVTAGTGGNPGTATCTTSSLDAGTDSVIATYSGDADHSGNSGSFSQTVSSATTTVTWATPAPITYGTLLSATQLDATASVSGTFVYTPAAGTELSAGTHTLSVTFTPTNSDFSPSSATVSLTVNPAPTTVTWAAPAAITYGTALSATQLDATASTSGTFVYTPAAGTILAAGTHTLSVTFTPGSSNYTGSTGNVTLTVNRASQTITATTPAPATATNGSSFTVVATASSGLAVTFSSSGACTNSGGTYTMNAATGTCTETLTQIGNSNYLAAPTVNESTTVARPVAQTVTFTTPVGTSSPYQSSFSAAATSTSGEVPTITATGSCSASGTTVTMTSGTGLCSVTASVPANDVYSAATATERTTATKIAPSVTFTGAPGSAVYLSTFPVASTTNDGVTPTIKATPGSVCSVSSGVVTMKSGTGQCVVTASWAATSDYLAASVIQTTSATPIGTTTTITSTVPQATHPLKVEVYFGVSNGTSTAVSGTVTVTASSGETCSGSVAGGKCLLTFTAAGSKNLTASYAGNTDNAASTSAVYPLNVQ